MADCHTAQVTEWGPLSFVWDQAFFSIFIPLRGAQTIVSYFVLNAKTHRCLGRELGTFLTSKKSNFKEMFDRNSTSATQAGTVGSSNAAGGVMGWRCAVLQGVRVWSAEPGNSSIV